jgi:nucleotide-binding universal stress UspA family protein
MELQNQAAAAYHIEPGDSTIVAVGKSNWKEFLPMKTIIVAIENIEGTSLASPVIEKTMELAHSFSSRVCLVHVVPRPGTTPFTVPREMLRDQAASELHHEHNYMQRLTGALRDRGINATALLLEGTTVKTILEEADRLDADLIVVSSHSHGLLYRALLDGTGERLLNQSTRPVLFVPEPPA